MIRDIALTGADKDWLPEDYWQSIPEYMRVGIQKHFAQRRLAMQASTDNRWLPISQFDGWPTGASNPVFVAVTAEGHEPVVGEAYWDPEAYGGTWWWAGTYESAYHDSPIAEMQHGAVTHFQPMPAPPSSSAAHAIGITANAILLLGYIGGAVSRDEVYDIESADTITGGQVIRHCASGNHYAVVVRQIDGVE